MITKPFVVAASLLLAAGGAMAETKYDSSPGRARDRREERTSAVRDVAIAAGRSPPSSRRSTPPRLQGGGRFRPPLTPGLIDMHVHVFAAPARRVPTRGQQPVPGRLHPAGRVTTVVDAGCAGWRNFADFKDRSSTAPARASSPSSTSWNGMRGGSGAGPRDMEAKPTADWPPAQSLIVASRRPIRGPEWAPSSARSRRARSRAFR